MSFDNKYLAIRLEGPLQSWGYDSQYNRRNTGLMPTKSAIAGMCCAALGFLRGSDAEKIFLESFEKVKMTAIAIPKKGQKKDLQVRRFQDYHTVQNTKTADGKNKDCHITNRQYLVDAAFGVVLEGIASLMSKIADALDNPVWGIWLGRKTCIPSSPVFAGIRDDASEALKLLIGDNSIESFTRQVGVANFAEGLDSLPDSPACFDSYKRAFYPRRVTVIQRNDLKG